MTWKHECNSYCINNEHCDILYNHDYMYSNDTIKTLLTDRGLDVISVTRIYEYPEIKNGYHVIGAYRVHWTAQHSAGIEYAKIDKKCIKLTQKKCDDDQCNLCYAEAD